MKRFLYLMILLFGITGSSYAQKFALIDMDYILNNISSYETAQEQLETMSKKWQGEIEAKQQEVKSMYKTYQADLVFLSAEQKTQRENGIVDKEREIQELNRKYFGPKGELFERREALIKPIQDEVYEAVKEISEKNGFQVILDKSSATSIIFSSPKMDISNEILSKLGYSK